MVDTYHAPFRFNSFDFHKAYTYSLQGAPFLFCINVFSVSYPHQSQRPFSLLNFSTASLDSCNPELYYCPIFASLPHSFLQKVLFILLSLFVFLMQCLYGFVFLIIQSQFSLEISTFECSELLYLLPSYHGFIIVFGFHFIQLLLGYFLSTMIIQPRYNKFYLGLKCYTKRNT